MSEERPASQEPERAPADSALPPNAEATLPQHTIEPTRTSM
jgi:hypothetical protein